MTEFEEAVLGRLDTIIEGLETLDRTLIDNVNSSLELIMGSLDLIDTRIQGMEK